MPRKNPRKFYTFTIVTTVSTPGIDGETLPPPFETSQEALKIYHEYGVKAVREYAKRTGNNVRITKASIEWVEDGKKSTAVKSERVLRNSIKDK